MREILNGIRSPISSPQSNKILYSILIFVVGIILGIVSKFLDETPSNLLPNFLDMLDLRNFFSQIGVWIFLSVVISIYSKSPFRAAINVFLFFVGMIGSYYAYTVLFAGFFPKSYMLLWISMTVISPFLAFVCWYAKGKSTISILISSIILWIISRQAFAFGFWYFDIRNSLELFLWLAMIMVLYESSKQIIKVLIIGLCLYFLTSQINLFWGLL